MESHDIPAYDEACLRGLTSTSAGDPVPADIDAAYWQFKRVCDRAGVTVKPNDLAHLAIQCGYGKPTAKEASPPTVVDLWRSKKIEHGAKVEVTWRKQKKPGTLVSVSGREAIVQIDGDSEERKFAEDLVSVA